MTVYELIQELSNFEADADVVFELDDDLEVESWTENRYGNKEVSVDCKLKVDFVTNIHGDCDITLVKEEE